MDDVGSGSGATDSSPSSHTVSELNLIGMFLTLALCLVTQPFGSLLYSFTGHWLSKGTFIFSRLHPLVCFSEALVIFAILLGEFITICKDGYYPTFARGGSLGVRIQWPTASHRLQVTAAALLLLRARATDEEGRYILERLHDEMIRDLAQGPVDSNAAPEPSEASGEANADEEVEETQAFGNANGPSMAAAPSASSANPVPRAPRRTVTMEEAGRSTTARQNLLRQSLGPNALSHTEFAVDFFTFVTMVITIVKLAVTVLPWHARTLAAFMITGWMAVQALLLLLHWRELDDLDMQKTVIEAWKWRGLTPLRDDDSLVSLGAALVLLVTGLVSGYWSFIFVTQYHQLPLWVQLAGCLITGLFSIVLCLFVAHTVSIYIPIWSFGATVLAWAEFNIGFQIIVGLLTTTMVLLFTLLPIARWSTEGQVFLHVTNFAFLMTLFVYMLQSYDEEESYKPEWLDVFG